MLLDLGEIVVADGHIAQPFSVPVFMQLERRSVGRQPGRGAVDVYAASLGVARVHRSHKLGVIPADWSTETKVISTESRWGSEGQGEQEVDAHSRQPSIRAVGSFQILRHAHGWGPMADSSRDGPAAGGVDSLDSTAARVESTTNSAGVLPAPAGSASSLPTLCGILISPCPLTTVGAVL